MRLYKDPSLKEPIDSLDLGTVSAGEKKQYIFYVQNDTHGQLTDIEFSIDHQEVFIIEAPKELEPNAVGKLVVEWIPSITLKQGLRTLLQFKGSEIYS